MCRICILIIKKFCVYLHLTFIQDKIETRNRAHGSACRWSLWLERKFRKNSSEGSHLYLPRWFWFMDLVKVKYVIFKNTLLQLNKKLYMKLITLTDRHVHWQFRTRITYLLFKMWNEIKSWKYSDGLVYWKKGTRAMNSISKVKVF